MLKLTSKFISEKTAGNYVNGFKEIVCVFLDLRKLQHLSSHLRSS